MKCERCERKNIHNWVEYNNKKIWCCLHCYEVYYKYPKNYEDT